MDLGLRGKKAIVTGATKGIGRGVVELLVAEGASVGFCARTPEEVADAVEAVKRPDVQVVGMGFGEGDSVVLLDDEGGGQRQPPALVAVDERNIDEDGAVVEAERLGDCVGDAELRGDGAAGIRKNGECERVLLDEEIVLARELRADGDEQRAAFANFRVERLPGFEFGDAVGAPAAAEKIDDEWAEGEEVVRADEFAAGR